MLTETQVIALLQPVKDPFIHKTLKETNGIDEVKIKESSGHVSAKIRIAKMNTPEQMQLQQEVVNKLKRAGAESVGLRFDQLSEEVLNQFQSKEEEKPTLLNGKMKTKFLAIASGKGGVGKSTVTVNMAVALARLGKKVGIIDADIYGFSVPDMMGITHRPKLRGNRIIPVEAHGVQLMSMGFFVENNEPVVWRGPRLGKMLKSFFVEVEWDELDYLLLDLPPGTGDMALAVHNTIPESKELIVTTPHPTAAFVATRAGRMAINTNHQIVGIVENMSYFQSEVTGEKEYVFGRGGGQTLADDLGAPLIGQIPLGQPNDDSNDRGSIYPADHPIGKTYEAMARHVLEHE
ncbi:ATP-binding protein involved in chromosome partitioning [Pelagirhabdus alkalitolerans]|uniref:Iron-sulfur cluster carrier protein n=1 Tax=Pelagirhabdus alkalitolerans TaxID=1612202 RepID=A0A1G6M2V4_9BACI|nr:Mrp/NBP35 family ATP-binding protein [Pelagirhabdus alkalitolerans]SDC49296.1 ATP-binding protein involved in chromosome partitioning [Pelagirhabdus alkalitolerans]